MSLSSFPPLRSLQFVPHGAPPPDDPRYALAVEGGRLMVARSLRQRGARVSVRDCIVAVQEALVLHALDPAGFARRGLDAAWRDALRRWCEVLIEQHGLRALEELNLRQALEEQRQHVEQARQQWKQLGLTARLAGLQGRLVRGRYPTRISELIAALQAAAERTEHPEHVPLLQAAGFDDRARAALANVVAALAGSQQAVAQLRARQAQLTDQMQVVRGALLAEVGRLRLAAALVLTPQQRGGAIRALPVELGGLGSFPDRRQSHERLFPPDEHSPAEPPHPAAAPCPQPSGA
ncbi:MAG: hypothetical protein RMK29_00910 [Myxococcales bacterium]|nr:hypothetical protein [Myxococcota bacterium]MDW8280238.1 hypothetical protein [Myxococcales bacterium]